MNFDEIMVIDDDKAINYFSQYIIESLNCCNKTSVYQLPHEALSELENRINQETKLPNVILLDLNMPKLNGWEFLDKYNDISGKNNMPKPYIFILTTSMNPEDEKKAKEIDAVTAFYKKPISAKVIEDIYENYLCAE